MDLNECIQKKSKKWVKKLNHLSDREGGKVKICEEITAKLEKIY